MTTDDALAHLRRVLRVDADREALAVIEAELRARRAAARAADTEPKRRP